MPSRDDRLGIERRVIVSIVTQSRRDKGAECEREEGPYPKPLGVQRMQRQCEKGCTRQQARAHARPITVKLGSPNENVENCELTHKAKAEKNSSAAHERVFCRALAIPSEKR